MPVGGHRARLAKIVKRERTRKGLSIRAAAAEAGVDRATWTAVEEATRVPQPHKAAQMEPVIGLGPGSFENILAGLDPVWIDQGDRKDIRADPDYRKWRADLDKIEEKGYSRREAIDALTDAEQSGVQDADRMDDRRDTG